MQPIFIYDGNCGFCNKCVKRWKRQIGDHVAFVPFQEKGYRFASIPLEHFTKAPHFADERGKVHAGAKAVVELFARGKGPAWHKWIYHKFPGGKWLCNFLFKRVSSCRECADKITSIFWRD